MHSTETRIYTALLTGFFILALVIAYFLITIIRYQRDRIVLYSERLNTEINFVENERLRIAKDLHDDLGSTLSAIKFRLNAFKPVKEEDVVWIEQSQKYLGESIARLRDIVLNITPQVLQRRGLDAAIDELLNRVLSSTGIKISTCYNVSLQNGETGILIYRIVQEIITNIVKHAHATNVVINLKMHSSHSITLHIADNGIGFSKRAVLKNNTGQGLQNIISRVDILNARMYLTAKPGEGTDYLIKIPVND